MKIITLSKSKFEQLEPLKLSKESTNTEGRIYDFNYRGAHKIIKKLHYESGKVFANKLYTIEMLDTYKEYLPDSFYKPDYLISVSGDIKGFTVPFVEGTNLTDILNDKSKDYKEKIYYLKKIGELLEQMHVIRKYSPLKDLYINDLHDSNFIVNEQKRQLYVIDLDSCKIANNNSSPARFLTASSLLNNVNGKYNINQDDSIYAHVIADSNSDLYCYNIMILNYLYGDNVDRMSILEFYKYLNYLDDLKLNPNLLEAFGNLVINKKNINPEMYLSSLTYEQIGRSKKMIYQKTSKYK